MKKVIFFHGYGGEPIPFITDLFEHIGYETIQQHINYDDEWDLDRCKSIVEKSIELSKDCYAIIGLSLGGYTAHLIANHLGKKCILINPGLDRMRSQLYLGNQFPTDDDSSEEDLKDFNFVTEFNKCELEVYLGGKDFQIPNNYTTEYLIKNKIDARVEILKDMYHVFNLQEFIKIIKMSEFFSEI